MVNIATRAKIIMCALLIIAVMMSGCVEEPLTSTPEVEMPTPTPTPEAVSEPAPVPTPSPEPTPEPTPEAFEVEIGEYIQSPNLKVSVTSCEVLQEWKYMGYSDIRVIYPEFQYQFIVFDCEIENLGAEQIYAGYIMFSMEDQNKYRYDINSIMYYDGFGALESLQELYSGQKMSGKIAFEIPTDSTENRLYYDFGSLFGTNLGSWNVTL